MSAKIKLGYAISLLLLECNIACLSAQEERPEPTRSATPGPLEEQILAERVSLETLLQTLGADHPQVRGAKSRLKALEETLISVQAKDPSGSSGLAKESLQLQQLEKNLGPEHEQVKALRQKIAQLEASQAPSNPLPDSQQNPYLLQQLAASKASLVEMRSGLGPNHPQTRSAEVQLKKLEDQLLQRAAEGRLEDSAIAAQLFAERNALDEMLTKFGAGHPLVQSTRSRIRMLERSLEKGEALPDAISTKKITQQLVEERLRLAELREKVGPGHPMTAQSMRRIQMLEEFEGAATAGRDFAQKEGTRPEDRNATLQLLHKYEVDHYLCLRVARELQNAMSKENADAAQLAKLREKLRVVVEDALQSRRELHRAEIKELRTELETLEKQIDDQEKSPQGLIESYLRTLNSSIGK